MSRRSRGSVAVPKDDGQHPLNGAPHNHLLDYLARVDDCAPVHSVSRIDKWLSIPGTCNVITITSDGKGGLKDVGSFRRAATIVEEVFGEQPTESIAPYDPYPDYARPDGWVVFGASIGSGVSQSGSCAVRCLGENINRRFRTYSVNVVVALDEANVPVVVSVMRYRDQTFAISRVWVPFFDDDDASTVQKRLERLLRHGQAIEIPQDESIPLRAVQEMAMRTRMLLIDEGVWPPEKYASIGLCEVNRVVHLQRTHPIVRPDELYTRPTVVLETPASSQEFDSATAALTETPPNYAYAEEEEGAVEASTAAMESSIAAATSEDAAGEAPGKQRATPSPAASSRSSIEMASMYAPTDDDDDTSARGGAMDLDMTEWDDVSQINQGKVHMDLADSLSAMTAPATVERFRQGVRTAPLINNLRIDITGKYPKFRASQEWKEFNKVLCEPRIEGLRVATEEICSAASVPDAVKQRIVRFCHAFELSGAL